MKLVSLCRVVGSAVDIMTELVCCSHVGISRATDVLNRLNGGTDLDLGRHLQAHKALSKTFEK